MLKKFFKTFLLLELFKGLAVTLRVLFTRKVTVQYPEEKPPYLQDLEHCMH